MVNNVKFEYRIPMGDEKFELKDIHTFGERLGESLEGDWIVLNDYERYSSLKKGNIKLTIQQDWRNNDKCTISLSFPSKVFIGLDCVDIDNHTYTRFLKFSCGMNYCKKMSLIVSQVDRELLANFDEFEKTICEIVEGIVTTRKKFDGVVKKLSDGIGEEIIIYQHNSSTH